MDSVIFSSWKSYKDTATKYISENSETINTDVLSEWSLFRTFMLIWHTDIDIWQRPVTYWKNYSRLNQSPYLTSSKFINLERRKDKVYFIGIVNQNVDLIKLFIKIFWDDGKLYSFLLTGNCRETSVPSRSQLLWFKSRRSW